MTVEPSPAEPRAVVPQIVEIRSAVVLDDSNRSRVKSLLRRRFGAQVEPIWQVDPSLLGGLVLRTVDQRLDASLRRQVDRLQRILLEASWQSVVPQPLTPAGDGT